MINRSEVMRLAWQSYREMTPNGPFYPANFRLALRSAWREIRRTPAFFVYDTRPHFERGFTFQAVA